MSPESGESLASDSDEEPSLSVAEGAFYLQVDRDPIVEYVETATKTGVLETVSDPLFATPDGEVITTETFELAQRRARAAMVNRTGQGGVCAGLHEARYGKRSDGYAD